MDVNKILADLRQERTRIDAAIEALSKLGSGAKTSDSVKAVTRKRKRMSAAARRKISLAQKKRWEKQKAVK